MKLPKEESLRNVYSHFALIGELIDQLASKIFELKNEVGLIKDEPILPLDKAKAISDFTGYMKKDYDKQFKKLLKDGRPIIYFLQSRPDYLKKFIPDSLEDKTKRFFQEIKNYRNYFVHTALPDSLYLQDSSGRSIKFAVKKEKLGEYKVFTEIKKKLESRNIDDFIIEDQLFTNDFYKVQDILNEIWEFFIQEMIKIAKQPKFKKIACL
jgi:hypothetical protein